MKKIKIHPDERQRRNPQGVEAGEVDAVYILVESKGPEVEIAVDHALRRVPYGAKMVANGGSILWNPDGMSAPYRAKAWTDRHAYFVPLEAAGAKWRFQLF